MAGHPTSILVQIRKAWQNSRHQFWFKGISQHTSLLLQQHAHRMLHDVFGLNGIRLEPQNVYGGSCVRSQSWLTGHLHMSKNCKACLCNENEMRNGFFIPATISPAIPSELHSRGTLETSPCPPCACVLIARCKRASLPGNKLPPDQLEAHVPAAQ